MDKWEQSKLREICFSDPAAFYCSLGTAERPGFSTGKQAARLRSFRVQRDQRGFSVARKLANIAQVGDNFLNFLHGGDLELGPFEVE